MFNAFISKIEPKIVKHALEHHDLVVAMHVELAEFDRNKVWWLIPKPEDVSVVDIKWVFKNKIDKEGNVVHDKARLVVKGYSLQDGIDYDATLSPIERLEAIRIFLAYVAQMNFDVYQMDVKCTLLNVVLEETIYVEQSPDFVNDKFPNQFYIFDKVVYCLKQAPRAWYATLTNFCFFENL